MEGYRRRFPDESATIDDFHSLISAWPDALDRSHRPGHLTASAWIIAPAYRRVLLLHHRKLGKWLQPGGHVDGDPDLPGAALREVREETGLVDLAVEADLFDVDIHRIPAYGDTDEHLHYDIRYLIILEKLRMPQRNDESHDVQWISVDTLSGYTTEESIHRMVRKSYPLFPSSSADSTS